MITKTNSRSSKIPPPPITFLMVRPLIKLLPDSKTMATLVNYTCKRFIELTPNLNNVHHFLHRCYKRRYISRKLNIRELLERSDCPIFRKALRTNSPLVNISSETNFTNYAALRKPCFHHPAILATERFKSSYVNRLIFSYDINFFMLIVEYIVLRALKFFLYLNKYFCLVT